MASAQNMRPRFFEGQYLGADDLTAVVEHARVSDARHSLGAHTWGIAIGLHLTEVTQPGGELQVFIQPGYGWDGFARPVVVLAPYAIPAALFEKVVYNPVLDEPSGRLFPIWLRYREAESREPGPGFELCNSRDQNSRIQETFVVEMGDRAPEDLRDNITVAGLSVKAEEAYRALDPSERLIYDASIPHQAFPAGTLRTRWLIPLGFVRWKPGVLITSPGAFQPLSIADHAAAAALRVHIGVVAEAVQAPAGHIRLKNRVVAPSTVSSRDLVWVEGALRVEGDARLFGSRLALVDSQGQNGGVPLTVGRAGDGAGPRRQMRIEIGNAQAGNNSLEIGPTVADTFQPRFSVVDNGNVGLGTDSPSAMLELRNGDLVMSGNGDDAGDIIFRNAASNTQKGRVWTNPAAGAGLYLASSGTAAHLAVDGAGLVGVGTTTPDRAMTIQGTGAGTYLNIRTAGNAQEVLIGADAGGTIVSAMTNHDLQLRSGGNTTRLWVKADGRIGIGTSTPQRQVHVRGDRIRLENDNKTVDLRADGSSVDLHSETNDLYVRSSGPGGNNRLLMNPFAGDGNVGIGTEDPAAKLHVRRAINGDAAAVGSYVALIDNASVGDSADVLALRIGANQAQPGNNYVTFFAGANAQGRIEGNGAGGVAYLSGGADFAECLPVHSGQEPLLAGEIVGVVEGSLTRVTSDAHYVSVVSDRPAVVGNAPQSGDESGYARVALLGQVSARVKGPVRAGDLIAPSGNNDGCGVAVHPDDACEQSIVGTAWESSAECGVKRVRIAVGLPATVARAQQSELRRLRHRIAELEG